MFSYYPRPQPAYYQPSPAYYGYQPSPYARALAQQQQRARAQQQLEQERLLAQQRASRYFPDGYDYEPDEEDDSYYYYTPRQRALLEAQRRQEALEQRKREAAARALYERAAMKQEQPVETLPPPNSPSPSPLPPAAQPSTSTPAPTPTPVPPSPPSPSPDLLNAAATKIQSHYRTHRALLTISTLLAQFEALKREFVPPTTIDYQSPEGGVVSVAVPPTTPPLPQPTGNENAAATAAQNAKLAYTPTNRPLHTYTELLARLLVALDAVESRGAPVVRERRRAAVRRVEGEAGRVEGIWRGVWGGYVEKGVHQGEEREEEGEVEAMVVEPTPELTDSAMVVEEERATPELTASLSDSDSDSEQDLPTPLTTPLQSPHVLPLPEFEEDGHGVVVERVLADEEKVEDFVVV